MPGHVGDVRSVGTCPPQCRLLISVAHPISKRGCAFSDPRIPRKMDAQGPRSLGGCDADHRFRLRGSHEADDAHLHPVERPRRERGARPRQPSPRSRDARALARGGHERRGDRQRRLGSQPRGGSRGRRAHAQRPHRDPRPRLHPRPRGRPPPRRRPGPRDPHRATAPRGATRRGHRRRAPHATRPARRHRRRARERALHAARDRRRHGRRSPPPPRQGPRGRWGPGRAHGAGGPRDPRPMAERLRRAARPLPAGCGRGRRDDRLDRGPGGARPGDAGADPAAQRRTAVPRPRADLRGARVGRHRAHHHGLRLPEPARAARPDPGAGLLPRLDARRRRAEHARAARPPRRRALPARRPPVRRDDPPGARRPRPRARAGPGPGRPDPPRRPAGGRGRARPHRPGGRRRPHASRRRVAPAGGRRTGSRSTRRRGC